jgi:5-methylcytosine-specific restriction endonuclease McrA
MAKGAANLKFLKQTPFMNKDYKFEYNEQLKDQRWFYVRSRVMERDKHKCKCCGTWRNLEVHHLRYEFGRKAWEYNDIDLVTLCHKCHEKAHKDAGTLPTDPWEVLFEKLRTVVLSWKAFIARGKNNG